MTTTQETTETEVEEYPFEAKISPHWALSIEQVLAVAAFGVLFIVLSYVPLRATDLWGHVAYGQWILNHRQLPTEDPAMPLARGMQVVDTAWLAQVALAAVDRYLGPEALSHLFALIGLVTYVTWARVFYLQSQRVWLSVLATLLLIFVGWSRLTTVRPETFAMLCGAVLFLLIARQQSGHRETSQQPIPSGWLTWIGVPLVFVVWANIHGSFVIGLAVLACFLFGRVIEVLWPRRSLAAVFGDAEVRRWTYLLELSLLATLINPYGVDLWIQTARFSANPNLRTVSEWQPLIILGTGGRQFAISIVLLMVVWRHSRRPIQPAEVLLLGLFAAAAIGGIRMIGWYAPVFAYVLTPHLADIAKRIWPAPDSVPAESPGVAATGETTPSAPLPLPGHSFRYSLVAILIIWIVFAVSPISQRVFSQRARRTPEQLYGKSTPVALVRFLQSPPKDNPLARKDQWEALVFHPQWWGDWLVRTGPPGFQPFVTTNIHLVPRQVWSDYLRVMSLQSGWERTLDRYHVGTIVVDKKEQPAFFSALKRHSDWQNAYEDEQSAVFVLRGQRTRASQNEESPTGEPA